MNKKKKPTMNEMKNVVSNLIMHVNTIDQHLQKMDTAVFNYIKFKGDEKEYIEYITKIAKEAVDEKGSDGENDSGDREFEDTPEGTKGEEQSEDTGTK